MKTVLNCNEACNRASVEYIPEQGVEHDATNQILVFEVVRETEIKVYVDGIYKVTLGSYNYKQPLSIVDVHSQIMIDGGVGLMFSVVVTNDQHTFDITYKVAHNELSVFHNGVRFDI